MAESQSDTATSSSGDETDESSSEPRGRTPLMRQYNAIKDRHPQAILRFRMGDVYGTFNEDAKTVSRILGMWLAELEYKLGGPITAVQLLGRPSARFEETGVVSLNAW